MKFLNFQLFNSLLFVVMVDYVSAGAHKTILISCDAFRWDYMQLLGKPTPNIGYLISNGVYADQGIRNQYTTITLPNHVSLATGRYVDDHGIVGNDMWDPVLKESFTAWTNVNGTTVNDDDANFEKDTRWMNNSAEPIWVTMTRQNAGKSAVMMWPFSSFKYNGMSADYWVAWNASVSYETRIDLLISELRKPEYTLGVLYFEELDEVGHAYGPYSPQMVEAIQRIDDVIGYLLSSLSAADLWPANTDILITADHGMTEINGDNAIYLPLYVNTSLITIYDENIWVKPGYLDEVYRNLSRAPHLRVYYKWEATPASEHFSHHRRVNDIIYFMDDGFYLSWSVPKNVEPRAVIVNDRRSENKKQPKGASIWGSHGYDNRYSTMWPTFIAAGPSFKTGTTVKPFNNTQVYCIICAINNVAPHPNAECKSNDTFILVNEVMLEPISSWPSSSESIFDQIFNDLLIVKHELDNFSTTIIVVSICVVVILFSALCLICRASSVRKPQRQLVIAQPARPARSGCYKAASCSDRRPVYSPRSGDEEQLFYSDDDDLIG